MVDYARKAKVIASGLHKKVSKIDKLTYLNSIDGIVSDKSLDDEYFDLCLEYDFKDIQEARKINLASYRRTSRLRERIQKYLTMGECLFLTLTFDDSTLNNTNTQTRKKYVSKCLKMISDYYVANIDFGSMNEREHYHAVVVAKKVSQEMWQYGNLDWQRIKVSNKSVARVPKYLNKLTNHAIKETTKRCCIIYSKKPKN